MTTATATHKTADISNDDALRGQAQGHHLRVALRHRHRRGLTHTWGRVRGRARPTHAGHHEHEPPDDARWLDDSYHGSEWVHARNT
jgi:hypothetical protein